MKDQYIKLIRNQIEKLDMKEFDLDSWKDSTILVLERIFGRDSEKIKRFSEIHYDLSSWSLRDTLGTSAHFDTCKKKGREILEVCIMEIETIGIAKKPEGSRMMISENIIAALEDELTISQFKELQQLTTESNQELKEKNLYNFLGKIGSENSMKILSKILASLEN